MGNRNKSFTLIYFLGGGVFLMFLIALISLQIVPPFLSGGSYDGTVLCGELWNAENQEESPPLGGYLYVKEGDTITINYEVDLRSGKFWIYLHTYSWMGRLPGRGGVEGVGLSSVHLEQTEAGSFQFTPEETGLYGIETSTFLDYGSCEVYYFINWER